MIKFIVTDIAKILLDKRFNKNSSIPFLHMVCECDEMVPLRYIYHPEVIEGAVTIQHERKPRTQTASESLWRPFIF